MVKQNYTQFNANLTLHCCYSVQIYTLWGLISLNVLPFKNGCVQTRNGDVSWLTSAVKSKRYNGVF